MNVNEILIRCSGLHQIMTEPKEKSYKDRLADACTLIGKYKGEYQNMNPDTKTAQKKLAQIQKLNTLILELDKVKDEIQLSETCKKFLIATYANQIYKRRDELRNKFLSKGNVREKDATTILSLERKIFYKQNRERLFNEYFSGEPDLFDGPEIRKARKTLDTKCSWSLITFLESQFAELKDVYDWQGQGYMDLTGAEEHEVVYCLVNGTLQAINDEIRRTSWQMGVLDASIETDPKFIEKVCQIERNHIFEINSFMNENPHYDIKSDVYFDGEKYSWEFDIPREKRIHTKLFKRDNDKIAEAKEKVIICREWMSKNFK